MTIGHSQGGHAALGAAQYASRANLDYKGTIAGAPPSNLNVILGLSEQLLSNSGIPLEIKIGSYAFLDTFTSYITAGLTSKNISYDHVFLSPTDKIASQVTSECTDNMIKAFSLPMIGYASSNSGSLEGYPRTKNDYMKIPQVNQFITVDSQPLQAKIDQPIIIYQGGSDTTVPKAATDLMLSGQYAKASNITYKTNDLWNHVTTYENNISNFVDDIKTLMPIKR